MTNYSNYTFEELIADEDFFQWIKHPTEESNALWLGFIADHPEKEALIHEAREFIVAAKDVDMFSASEKAALWQEINSGTDLKRTPYPHKRSPVRKLVLTMVAAASIIAFIGIMILWYSWNNRITIHAGFAQKKTVILPDGSEIVLNSHSSVSYFKNWEAHAKREVWLEGEAFFKVVHVNIDSLDIKPKERFYVHANEVDVEVLGTEFNVYMRRGNTNISLNSGKVKLHIGSKEEVIMKPGEIVAYKENKKAYVKQQVDAGKYSSWVSSNKISLAQTSLQDVLRIIEDTYGLKAEIDDPAFLVEKLSGELPADNEVALLAALEKTLKVTIIRSGANNIKIITRK